MEGDAAARIREIRKTMMTVDPNSPIDSIRTVRDQVNWNLQRDRLIVWLASVFGALALGLACSGIYGTMSYAVARRVNEIGIHMALGAVPGRVFRLVFCESLALLALGLLTGAPLVLTASRSRVVLGVDVGDPLIPAGAALVVTATAAFASYRTCFTGGSCGGAEVRVEGLMHWWRRKQREQDLERELRTDLDLEAAEQQQSGLSEVEARYAAQRAFGNIALIKEDTRAMWGWIWLERFGQDLSYALRTARREPGFATITIATLALAIGINTAVFGSLAKLGDAVW